MGALCPHRSCRAACCPSSCTHELRPKQSTMPSSPACCVGVVFGAGLSAACIAKPGTPLTKTHKPSPGHAVADTKSSDEHHDATRLPLRMRLLERRRWMRTGVVHMHRSASQRMVLHSLFDWPQSTLCPYRPRKRVPSIDPIPHAQPTDTTEEETDPP